MTRINLTQHNSTEDQGCVEPNDKSRVQDLLTFNTIPVPAEMRYRAGILAEIAKGQGASEAMIGGAPYFMSYLERALKQRKVKPVYAFSVRESVDQVQPDGSTKKVAVFKHAGFVTMEEV
jgi:hypothetical protein